MRFLVFFLGGFNIFLCKILKKDWYNPAMIYTLMWSLFCIIPSCVVWTDITWDYYGLCWIELSCTFIIIGQGLANSVFKKKYSRIENDEIYTEKMKVSVPNIKVVAQLLLLICLAYSLWRIYQRGFSLSIFSNIDELFSINEESAYDRYYGNSSSSMLNQIILVLEYALPLLGGLLFAYAEKKEDKIFAVLTLTPIALSMFTSNVKSGFIANIISWVVSYVVGHYVKNGKHIKIEGKLIVRVLVLFLAFLFVLFISMCLRIGSFDDATIEIVKNKFMKYAFGGMRAIDEWITHDAISSNKELGWGVNTYMWIFSRLGLASKVQGVYGYANTIYTNIFTIFRGIISDFGLIGGFIYSLLKGFFGGYYFIRLETNKKITASMYVLLCAWYFGCIYGFIISPWIYTSYAAAYIFFIIILWGTGHVRLKRSKR